MDNQEKSRDRVDPATLPDVATGPHGMQVLPGDAPPMGEGLLEDVLPAVSDAARKVGGFRRLADLARQLDRDGEQPSDSTPQEEDRSNEQHCSSF